MTQTPLLTHDNAFTRNGPRFSSNRLEHPTYLVKACEGRKEAGKIRNVFLPDTSKVQLPGEISQQWRTVTFQTNGMGAQTSSRHRFVRIYPLGKTAFHHLQNRTTNKYAAWADWFYSHQSPASASTEGSNDKPKWFQNYVIGLQEFIGISLVPARNCSRAWCPEKCFLWQSFTMLLTIVCSVAGVSLGQGCSYATVIYCIRSIRLYVIDLIRFRDLQRYDLIQG